jgi:hypothetical protein
MSTRPSRPTARDAVYAAALMATNSSRPPAAKLCKVCLDQFHPASESCCAACRPGSAADWQTMATARRRAAAPMVRPE